MLKGLSYASYLRKRDGRRNVAVASNEAHTMLDTLVPVPSQNMNKFSSRSGDNFHL